MGVSKFMKMKVNTEDNFIGPVNCWKALAIGIVQQAVIDWRRASLALANPETATHEMNELKNSAEYFFRSPYCEFLSGLDGKTLLRKLKEGIV